MIIEPGKTLRFSYDPEEGPRKCIFCNEELEFGTAGNLHFQCAVKQIARDAVLKVLKEKGLIE
jgi:hypothetical protein